MLPDVTRDEADWNVLESDSTFVAFWIWAKIIKALSLSVTEL